MIQVARLFWNNRISRTDATVIGLVTPEDQEIYLIPTLQYKTLVDASLGYIQVSFSVATEIISAA